MISIETRPTSPSSFQFRLRTLLLLFVVLGSSLAVFGGWGIVVSAFAVGVAIYVRQVRSLRLLKHYLLGLFCLPPIGLPCPSIPDMSGLRPRHGPPVTCPGRRTP